MMFSSIRAEIQKMQIQIIDDVITKPILYKTLKVHKIKWYQTWQEAFNKFSFFFNPRCRRSSYERE